MKCRKAQGIVITIFLFMAAIMMSLLVFMVTGVEGRNVVETNVDQEVSYGLAELRKRSVVTTTMNDYMWRADGVGETYGDYTAYEVISLYFSSEGDNIYISDGDGSGTVELTDQRVREDIETYLKYKMDQYWRDGPNRIGYYLEIQGPPEKDISPIVVKAPEDYQPGRFSRVTYPLSITEGYVAEITLWTQTSKNIYDVGVSSTTDVPNVGSP